MRSVLLDIETRLRRAKDDPSLPQKVSKGIGTEHTGQNASVGVMKGNIKSRVHNEEGLHPGIDRDSVSDDTATENDSKHQNEGNDSSEENGERGLLRGDVVNHKELSGDAGGDDTILLGLESSLLLNSELTREHSAKVVGTAITSAIAGSNSERDGIGGPADEGSACSAADERHCAKLQSTKIVVW